MNCPQCSEVPNGYFDQFRFGGVRFGKYLQGFIKCRHCGSILKVSGYEKVFRLVFPSMLVLAFVAGILFDYVMAPLKSKPMIRFTFFLLYLILVTTVASFLSWKYRRFEKANVEKDMSRAAP